MEKVEVEQVWMTCPQGPQSQSNHRHCHYMAPWAPKRDNLKETFLIMITCVILGESMWIKRVRWSTMCCQTYTYDTSSHCSQKLHCTGEELTSLFCISHTFNWGICHFCAQALWNANREWTFFIHSPLERWYNSGVLNWYNSGGFFKNSFGEFCLDLSFQCALQWNLLLSEQVSIFHSPPHKPENVSPQQKSGPFLVPWTRNDLPLFKKTTNIK